MELKEYIKIFKEEKKSIITITFLVLLATLFFSVSSKSTYETSISLFINKKGTQDTEDFKYDGYYALESTEKLAEDIEQSLQSPQIVNEIYQKAGIDPNFDEIKEYKKSFTANKMSGQYVEVYFKSKNREDAEKIANSIPEIVKNRINNLQQESNEEISYSIENSDPITIERKSDITINLLIGLISGLFLALITVLTKRYFK